MCPQLIQPRQKGFGLVEIMVGLVIGMLATLVIMQVFAVFEEQKRTTTGSADAQTSGGVALYLIGRDLQMAGFGLTPAADSPLECTALTVEGAADVSLPLMNRLSPTTVADGGVAPGASDTLTIRYGNTPMGGIPTQIVAMGAPTVNDATVTSNLGCRANDVTLVVNGANCALSTATAVTSTGAVPPVHTVTLQNSNGVLTGASLSCLGTWVSSVYAVANGNLALNGADRVPGVVNLQVQFGISATAGSNTVTRWVNAKNLADWSAAVDGPLTGANWGSAMTVSDRNRIKAVRVAIIARNGQYEKEVVTSACSSLTAASPTGLCAWEGTAASPAPSINLSNDPDWAHYRYRVFETVIPLRNVVWSKDTL